MDLRGDFDSDQKLDSEAWRVALRSLCGQYNPEGPELKAFAGSVRPLSICGRPAIDIRCNAHRVVRTYRDVRLDGMEHFYAVIQLVGKSSMVQNDRVVDLALGDIALVDSARPVTYFPENRPGRWLTLPFPREALVSHLGVEPEGGLCRHGETLAGRALFRLIQDAVDGGGSSAPSDEPYVQLAIYDLVGALFAPSDLTSISSHSDKLFKRVCCIIKGRSADPAFGPAEAAAEAGISLRYLQKLFTARNSSCTHFINSARLDHAACLLHRRVLLNTSQPVREIAYTSGYGNYTHFARQFRRRFGHPPGSRPPTS